MSLRPAHEVARRLLHDPALDPADFVFAFRDGQAPVLRVARADAANDCVNGTQRALLAALPAHRIAFFAFGAPPRLVWHRARRLDLVFGSGDPDARADDDVALDADDASAPPRWRDARRIADVVASHAAWARARASSARGAEAAARAALGAPALDELRGLARELETGALRPAAWAARAAALAGAARDDDADAALAALVRALPQPALREALLSALSEATEERELEARRTGAR